MECDTMREDYDLIVIGGGPGGYLAAITAAKEGLSVLLFEGGRIGGTCLNVGCIPTKYLLDKAAAMDKVRSLVDQKIFRECGLFSFRKMQEGRNEVVHKLVSGVEYLLEANKVRVVHAYAALAGPGEVECDGIRYRGKDILIATGSVPSFIPIEGAEYAMTSTQVLELEKVPGRLAVIGGGAGWYFKIYRPKHQAPDLDEEEIDFEEEGDEPDGDSDLPPWDEDEPEEGDEPGKEDEE